jgi:hypothetical protein
MELTLRNKYEFAKLNNTAEVDINTKFGCYAGLQSMENKGFVSLQIRLNFASLLQEILVTTKKSLFASLSYLIWYKIRKGRKQ